MKKISKHAIRADGTEVWYCDLNGVAPTYHRENGPAIIHANGNKLWYFHGKAHRRDGPAKEYTNGRMEWWLNGKRLDPKDYVNDYAFKRKHPDLVASMLIYLVHKT